MKKWHSLYLVYIHQYLNTKNTNRATIEFHKSADAANNPTTTATMKHVFGNTAIQFKVFDHQRFQIGIVSSPPPPIINTLHSRRQSSAMEQPCKIENRTNTILVNQLKNETATKMKVSPLQVAFTLNQVFGGWGKPSLGVGEGPSQLSFSASSS